MSYSKVLLLLPLLFNHDNFDTKTTSEIKSYFDEGWLFIRVGSVSGMIYEAVLAQFTDKPA